MTLALISVPFPLDLLGSLSLISTLPGSRAVSQYRHQGVSWPQESPYVKMAQILELCKAGGTHIRWGLGLGEKGLPGSCFEP